MDPIQNPFSPGAGSPPPELVGRDPILEQADIVLRRIRQKNRPFDFVVADESQDISVSQLRFLASIGGDRPNALFFAGDLGQRIFQQPFSWKSLGVDIRGRSRTLRVNYRTSHQIRVQADRLLSGKVSDVDGNEEDRSDAISVFNGPPPTIQVLKTETAEQQAVVDWLGTMTNLGILPHETGLIVRSAEQFDRAKAVVEKAKIAYKILDDHAEPLTGQLSICTMHLAKGLEFRSVAVMACDDEVIPLQKRIESVGDEADLQEVYDTERHLLYVACTRARDHLLVTSVEPASEFLDDMQGSTFKYSGSSSKSDVTNKIPSSPTSTKSIVKEGSQAKSNKADSISSGKATESHDNAPSDTASGSHELGLGPDAEFMRALSIRQPFVEAIMRGIKTIEYRSTATKVRGPILIYASQTRYSEEDEVEMLDEFGIDDISADDLPRGVIVGSVELYDCDGGEWYLQNPIRAEKNVAPVNHPNPVWFFPFNKPEK